MPRIAKMIDSKGTGYVISERQLEEFTSSPSLTFIMCSMSRHIGLQM